MVSSRPWNSSLSRSLPAVLTPNPGPPLGGAGLSSRCRCVPSSYGSPWPRARCHQQRSVLSIQLRLDLRRCSQQCQELRHEHLVEQLISVLGDCEGISNEIVRIAANKPSHQQVVVEMPDQSSPRVDVIHGLQQNG